MIFLYQSLYIQPVQELRREVRQNEGSALKEELVPMRSYFRIGVIFTCADHAFNTFKRHRS